MLSRLKIFSKTVFFSNFCPLYDTTLKNSFKFIGSGIAPPDEVTVRLFVRAQYYWKSLYPLPALTQHWMFLPFLPPCGNLVKEGIDSDGRE